MEGRILLPMLWVTYILSILLTWYENRWIVGRWPITRPLWYSRNNQGRLFIVRTVLVCCNPHPDLVRIPFHNRSDCLRRVLGLLEDHISGVLQTRNFANCTRSIRYDQGTMRPSSPTIRRRRTMATIAQQRAEYGTQQYEREAFRRINGGRRVARPSGGSEKHGCPIPFDSPRFTRVAQGRLFRVVCERVGSTDRRTLKVHGSAVPTLAKGARVGHPLSWWYREPKAGRPLHPG